MRMVGKNAQRFFGLLMCFVMLAGMLSTWPVTGYAAVVGESQLSSAGVYGWQIMKTDGTFIGGVRYPGNVGTAPVMTLTDQHFPYIRNAADWGQYETATVDIGPTSEALSTPEGRERFAAEIAANYQVQILLVDGAGTYANGEYPYAWVTRKITRAE